MMNCDNDFYVRYNRTYVKVKPFCESSDLHYKVYLLDQEVKIQSVTDENGDVRWIEYKKGETDLANELGRLIMEQHRQ
jgi:hypothetical protein